MRKMMFAEAQLGFVAERRIDLFQFAQQKIALEQLLADPERHGFAE